eukprot:522639_1
MAAEPGAPLPDAEFTQCVTQCHEALNDRISYACIEAWQDEPEGHAGRIPKERERAMGTSASLRRRRAPADASLARARAIMKTLKKKERAAPESVHSEEQCHLSSSQFADLLRTRGGSSLSSVGSGLHTGGGSSISSVGSLSSVKIIGGPGLHHKASSSSISSSCDTATRILEQCWARSSSSSMSQLVHGQETIGAGPLAMHEDYGNYYAANMQPMNGLHLYDLNEIHECQMNLEQCQQSQHSLFLLDGVLLLTLVSLSFIGLLCVVCLCIVIIGRYIPFNQRKSGYVSYQNADTEIGNL